MPAIIATAEVTDAEAIHPGYGFLSENADFAERVERSGFTFIGPTPASIRVMGDKVSAKQAMIKSGVPCVPGSEGALPDDPKEIIAARAVGYPVIIKASGGGGGRSRVVHTEAALLHAVQTTRAEAGARSSAAVYMEDSSRTRATSRSGLATNLGGLAGRAGLFDAASPPEIIEETPAPGVPRRTIRRSATARRSLQAIGYRSAGTFRFLYRTASSISSR
jgi:acetyl-CoA carboxylase biotin carboxylase subunit